jgi:hypothetical protein
MGWIWTAVLNGGLGVAAYWVARFGLRQPPGLPRALAAGVLAWAWLTIGMEALGALGLLARGPLLGWVSAGLLIGLACRTARPGGAGPVETGTGAAGWAWEEIVALGLVLWPAAALGTQSLIGPVKVLTDGPIYHLYFAARWWKSGRLDLIAAPFGENAATYFPAVGDVWLSWLMIGLGGDTLAKVGQAPFLALAGLAVLALCRRLGAGRPSAAVAAAWFVTSSHMFLFSFEANVDTVFVAGYLVAVYFFVEYSLGDGGVSSLALGALGAGLAVGTKAPGIVFVPPLLALGAALAVWRGRGWQGKVGGALTVGLVPLSVAGFWWARNAMLTGNPLYPLHLEAFGRVWLAGWYGPEVMKLSQYYIPVSHWRALVDMVLGVFDPRLLPVWLAALSGAWAVGVKRRSPVDGWVWVISGLAVANVALYWLLIPYRTQQRFMFHAVGLAAVPLARTFERGRLIRAVGVGLLAVHVLTWQGWPVTEKTPPWLPAGKSEKSPPWDLDPRVPNNVMSVVYNLPTTPKEIRGVLAEPIRLVPVACTLCIGLAAFATAWAWGRLGSRPSPGRRARAGLATAVLIAVMLALSSPMYDDARNRFFPRFPEYYLGWLALDLRSGPIGTRVAYSGNDLPYYLQGVGLRNTVRYVNIDAHPDWLLHDYHLAASAGRSRPALWDYPRPGWDRIHPDYDAWLANLRAEGIQLLVVTKVNPAEGPHNVADPEKFPIERRWAEAHPETFELLYGPAEGDPEFRLYRVKPPRESSPGRP